MSAAGADLSERNAVS